MNKQLIALGLVGAAAYFILKGGDGQGLTVGGDSPPGTVLSGMSQPSQSGSSASAPNMTYNISFPEFNGFPSGSPDSGATKKETASRPSTGYFSPEVQGTMMPSGFLTQGTWKNSVSPSVLAADPYANMGGIAPTKKETATTSPVTFGGGGAGARADTTTRTFNPTTVFGTAAPVSTTLGGGGIYEAFPGSSKLNVETKKMSTAKTVSSSSSAKGSGYSRFGLSTSSY